MNLLERVLTLLRANLNNMAEKSLDPEKALQQIQLDMRNQLVQVKTQVATAIAESMKLQKRNKEKQAEANLWHQKAAQAVQQNSEQAARDYLSRYNDLIHQIQRYQQQQKEQEQLVATMRGILRQLEAKISEVETTLELLATRKRTALLQQRVYDALNKSTSPIDKERTSHAQDALLEIEARARAMAELQQHDLNNQLEQISQERLIEEQLQHLRGQKDQKREKPLLLDSGSHPADLLRPIPTQGQPAQRDPENRLSPDVAAPASSHKPVTESQELSLEKLRKLMEK
jgi:phage shock protein A